MREMRRVAVPDQVADICVSAERMFVSCHDDQRIVGYDVSTFDIVCEHRVGDNDALGEYTCMVVSDGVLFAAGFFSDNDGDNDGIRCAHAASTLQALWLRPS